MSTQTCGCYLSETWDKAAGPVSLSKTWGKWYLFSLFVCSPGTTFQSLLPLGQSCFPSRKSIDSLDRDEKLWTHDLVTVPGKQLHCCFIWFTMAMPLPICKSAAAQTSQSASIFFKSRHTHSLSSSWLFPELFPEQISYKVHVTHTALASSLLYSDCSW